MFGLFVHSKNQQNIEFWVFHLLFLFLFCLVHGFNIFIYIGKI